MPYPLDDATATALIALHPWVLQRHPQAPVQAAVEVLLQAEQARRGHPDPKTGALQVPALTQEGGWQGLTMRQLYHDRDEVTVTAHKVT